MAAIALHLDGQVCEPLTATGHAGETHPAVVGVCREAHYIVTLDAERN